MREDDGNLRKRAVVNTTKTEPVEHQVRLQPERFDSLVFDKGYEVFIEKAYRCPCSVKGSGQPLVSCNNCLGVGWIFTDGTDTRAVIQGITAKINNENWTQTNSGFSRITVRAIDRLSFMDRITIKDLEGYFNEVVFKKKLGNKDVFITEYPILSVESIFMFESADKPLNRLKEGEDFEIERTNIIRLLKDFNSDSISIRYRHSITYHVVEMTRDILRVRTKQCKDYNEELKDMPISGVIRKSHYLFENSKFYADERLINN